MPALKDYNRIMDANYYQQRQSLYDARERHSIGREVSERRQTPSSWQTKDVAFEGRVPSIGNGLNKRVEVALGQMFAWRGKAISPARNRGIWKGRCKVTGG